MKNYVDSVAGNYNASYNALIRTDYVYTDNGSYILGTNTTYALDSEVTAVNSSMKDYVDIAIAGVGSPDLTVYPFLNGTRAFTGNVSMSNKYISNLVSGDLGSDAVNKSYVDSVASSYNATYDAYTNYNATYDAKADTNYNASYATTTYVGEVNTSMKKYVEAAA